MIGAGALAGHT